MRTIAVIAGPRLAICIQWAEESGVPQHLPRQCLFWLLDGGGGVRLGASTEFFLDIFLLSHFWEDGREPSARSEAFTREKRGQLQADILAGCQEH